MTLATAMPGPARVCAVSPAQLDLGRQARTLDEHVTLGNGGAALHDAVLAALTTGSEWLWLVGRGADVDEHALEALLAAAAHTSSLHDPVLFAGKPVDEQGRLDSVASPVVRNLARELAIAGAQHRLVAIRAAPYGSLLVRREAVERHGPPRVDFAGAGDDLEWTGRMLRDAPGYLVPGSTVRFAHEVKADVRRLTRNRVRMLRGDGWVGAERLWSAFVLTEELARTVVEHPTTAPGLLRAVGNGVRAGA